MRERHDRLWQALAALPPRDRQLIVLRGLEGHAIREIATLLGLRPNTVTVAYHRACAKLKGQLGPGVLDDLSD